MGLVDGGQQEDGEDELPRSSYTMDGGWGVLFHIPII